VWVVALLNDQLFVARQSVAGVLVYNTSLGSLQLTRTITFSGLTSSPNGLTTSSIDNCLYVSDYNNRAVHRVNLSVTSNVSFLTWGTSGRLPQALSMTRENSVLVTTVQKTLDEYTPSGSLVRSISTTNSPWQAVQVNSTVWAFTMYSPVNQICTVLTTGAVINCFGSTAGPGLAQAMWNPQGMVIDTRGYMLIADSGINRILLVDPTLSSARQLQLPVNPGLNSPFSVSYDQSLGRLVVGERFGQFRLFLFDGVWW